MPLNIKSAEADRLARELSALTGESITEAVTRALQERLERRRDLSDQARRKARAVKIDQIMELARSLPLLDDRPADEILGYDEDGTFA
jgi:antitoxin VapB